MQNRQYRILILFLVSGFFVKAQDPAVIQEYINTYRELAIKEMQRTGVPASIKLAQGIHETAAGTSNLVLKSNNHFGIKCKSDWTGPRVSHTDDAPNECFRKYESSEASYKDHSDFLRKSSRYASLFDLDPTDYSGWAYGLKKAGYATNPKYSQVLIRLIEEYHLQDYTLIALGKMTPGDEILTKNKITETKQKTLSESSSGASKPENNESDKAPEEIKAEPEIVYPEGEFRINDTRVIYAKKGTSFLSIAQQYGIPLARIFEFNDMKPREALEKDQLIFIMRKRKTGTNEYHIVKEGESVHDIAQSEALRLDSLIEYNNIKPGVNPIAGTLLYLRTKAPALNSTTSGK